MNYRFSVIIPVYNAEKTLHRCVDSLLLQNCVDAQIILINDGSKDHSGAICEEYAAKHENVQYIAQENSGVSVARNAGLAAAIGEYVMFVDSDDFVSEDYFAVIDTALQEYDYDLIQFSRVITDGKNESPRILPLFSGIGRTVCIPKIVEMICRKTINPPWAKVYKREILIRYNLFFPMGVSIAEDRAFNIAYSTHIGSYRILDKPIYYVCTENENSLSRKKHSDQEAQFEIAGRYAREHIDSADIPQKEKDQYYAAMNYGTCRSIYKTAKDLHRARVPYFKRQVVLLRQARQINRKKMQYPKTRYCLLTTLPVKLYLAPVIDLIAWKLVRG